MKNFSMLLSAMGWTLAPAYDLLNVKIILPSDKEDIALLFGGKKMNFTKGYFDRFTSALHQNDNQIRAVYKRILKWLPEAIQLIDISFLSENNRTAYKALVTQRVMMFA